MITSFSSADSKWLYLVQGGDAAGASHYCLFHNTTVTRILEESTGPTTAGRLSSWLDRRLDRTGAVIAACSLSWLRLARTYESIGDAVS